MLMNCLCVSQENIPFNSELHALREFNVSNCWVPSFGTGALSYYWQLVSLYKLKNIFLTVDIIGLPNFPRNRMQQGASANYIFAMTGFKLFPFVFIKGMCYFPNINCQYWLIGFYGNISTVNESWSKGA